MHKQNGTMSTISLSSSLVRDYLVVFFNFLINNWDDHQLQCSILKIHDMGNPILHVVLHFEVPE